MELGCERQDDGKIETFQGNRISMFLSQSEGFMFWRTSLSWFEVDYQPKSCERFDELHFTKFGVAILFDSRSR